MDRNWSIEKGDYQRRGLSSQEVFYKSGISKPNKIFLYILSLVVAILTGLLFIRMFNI